MLETVIILILVLALGYSNHRIAARWEMPLPVKWLLQGLLIYHLIFTAVFTYYILDRGGDATAYWTLSTNVMPAPSDRWGDHFGLSTWFVQWLNFVPYKLLGFSFYTGNVLYGLMGFMGIRFLFLLAYDSYVRYIPARVQPYPLLIFFLPNLHFWTAGIGKEALTLFALSGFLYGIHFFRRWWWLGILSWAMLFLVRPHIGFLAVALLLSVLLLFSRFTYKIKLAIMLGLGGLLVLLGPLLVTYLNIPDFSWSSFRDLMSFQIDFLQHGGSSVDLASYNQAQRLLTYLFRPFFFDAYHWESYLASAENAVYAVSILLFIYYFNWGALRRMPLYLAIGLLLFLVTTVLFANSLSNLGIMMRMKSFTMIFMVMGGVYMLVSALYDIPKRQ